MCTVLQDVRAPQRGREGAERPEPGVVGEGLAPRPEGGRNRSPEGLLPEDEIATPFPTEEFRVLTSDSYAGPGDAGRTGSWRVLRPVIDYGKCTPARTGKPACFLCWLFCPDSVVSKTVRPEVDLDYCKGCGICAEECPTKAISMVEESGFTPEDPA